MDEVFRVVVADDEKLIANNIAKNIEKAHSAFRVVGIACDGAQALEMVDVLLPHVVFSDIKMPVMDGLQLFETLNEHRPEIRKVIISGYDDFQFVREAMQNQTLNYMLKPVSFDELRETLNKLYAQLCGERSIISSEVSQSPEQIAETVLCYIREHYTGAVDFSKLAVKFGFSGSYLARIFRERTGMSPQRYLIDCRIVAAKRLLADTELLVHDVGTRVGYADPFHFCKVFKQNVGVSPSQYRKQNRLPVKK